jgi:glycosyltransferase involved in cell wall biosynthesis
VPEAEAVRRYRQRHGLPAGRTVVGSIGRLAGGGVKGFDLLLEAARRLRPAVPDLHVLIVGEGPRRAFLQAQVRRLGLGGLVHLVGAEADIRLPLAAMDVFVFPVRWQEGFGLSLIEAMAAGRPVVASRIGAVPEIVEHGRSGWLVEPEDPAALADAIARALVDPAAAEMGRQAQARVRTAFTLEQMVGKVEAVYREVAE